jgi:hypothetical protein
MIYPVKGYNHVSIQRQYPQISLNDPGQSFLQIIRDGNFEDSPAEYGALTVARTFPRVVAALAEYCDHRSFVGQTVGDKYIEMLLVEGEEPPYDKMKNLASVMRDRGIDTPYSRIIEVIASTQLELEGSGDQILALLDEVGIRRFVQELVTVYFHRPKLADVFDTFDSKITQLIGNDLEDTLPDEVNHSAEGYR